MAIIVHLTTPASIASVKEAIRHRAAYWRESEVPPELRARGARKVEASIKGDTFQLTLFDFNQRPGATYAVADGRLASLGGMTVVDARIGLPISFRRYPWFLVVIAAFFLWRGDPWWTGLIFLAASPLLHLHYKAWDHSITRDTDPGAAHLADRLEAAIVELSSVEAPTRAL